MAAGDSVPGTNGGTDDRSLGSKRTPGISPPIGPTIDQRLGGNVAEMVLTRRAGAAAPDAVPVRGRLVRSVRRSGGGACPPGPVEPVRLPPGVVDVGVVTGLADPVGLGRLEGASTVGTWARPTLDRLGVEPLRRRGHAYDIGHRTVAL